MIRSKIIDSPRNLRLKPRSFSTGPTLANRIRVVFAQTNAGLATSEKTLVAWGLGIMAMYAMSFILPNTILGTLRWSYLLCSIVFLPLALAKFRGRLAICFPVAIALLIQLWSIFCAFHANIFMGRPILIGRAETYILEAMVPGAVAYALVSIQPFTIKWITTFVLAVFGVSVFVGWLQFFKFGPALALAPIYTYKSISGWDGTAGLRAIGLTFHPNSLSYQAMIGVALVGSRVFFAKVRSSDVFGLFYFSGGVIISQARLGYIVLVLFWVLFLPVIWKHNQRLAMQIVTVGVVLMVVAVIAGSKRLGYALQSSSVSSDSSLQHRETLNWAQINTIWPKYSMTGIGPDSGLLLGTGPEDKFVPIGGVMESGYRVFVAMYGIPGLVLFIVGLFGGMISAGKVLLNKLDSPERRQFAGVAMMAAMFIAINCNTANTVDGYMQLPFAFLAAGVCMRASKPLNPTGALLQSG